MNKLVGFLKKHCVASVTLVGVFALLIMRLIIYLFKRIIVFVIGKAKAMIYYFASQQFANQLMEFSNLTDYKWMNAVISYLELCILFVTIWIVIAMIMAILVTVVEKIWDLLRNLILGKSHERSLRYNTFQVWFLKLSADVNIIIFWIKFNICGVRSYGETDISMVKKAKVFTMERIICFMKKYLRFFFDCSIVHLVFTVYVVYIYYFQLIQDCFVNFCGFFKTNAFSVSDALDFFELISIIFLLGYIFLDVRHKATGYSEIRTERFKELFQIEEKLLNILRNINYELETNIDVIVDRKPYILQAGAKNLTGKDCYIYDGKIEYEDKKYWNSFHKDDTYFQLRNLTEMNKEFDSLSELNKEFKKSSLSYSNIYLIDHETMLTKLIHFYFPGRENFEYKKMQLFCKSSMEKWFERRFIKPIIYGDEKKYYTEEQANEVILDASDALDFELMHAFELEVYLRRYEKKMIKRFKKINKFSRFNIN